MSLHAGESGPSGSCPWQKGRRLKALSDGMTALLRAVFDERTLMGPFAFPGVMGAVFRGNECSISHVMKPIGIVCNRTSAMLPI